MKRRAEATISVVVAGLCVAGPAHASFYGKKTAAPLPAIAGNVQGPVGPADIDVIENLGQKVPRGLAFTDGHGRPVTLDSLLGQGKPLVVTLGYYHCPMLCNLVHEGLVKAIGKSSLVLGKDFLGLSVSVDPNEDPKSANTQQRRLLRALQHGKPEEWPFVFSGPLRGSPNPAAMGSGGQSPPAPDAISSAQQLAEAVGFRYKYDPQSKQFAHSAVAFVLTPEGTIARYLYGVDFLPRDFRFALVEAGGGRVGTSLDRVLLACFHYDPMAQRYTPYGIAFVRIGAGLSGIALFALLAILWRKEIQMRRRRAAA